MSKGLLCPHDSDEQECVKCSLQKGMEQKYLPPPVDYENNAKLPNAYGSRLNDYWNTLEDKTGADNSPKYDLSKPFAEVAMKYLASREANELRGYLKGQNRQFYDLAAVGSSKLEDRVAAAVASNGKDAALIGNHDFKKQVEHIAKMYKVSKDIATRYVLDHEHVHLSQKGKGYDDHVQAELDVERTLKGYYKSMAGTDPAQAKEYEKLSYIAGHREANVSKNYGHLEGKSVLGNSGRSNYSPALVKAYN